MEKGLGKIFLHGATVHVGPHGRCDEDECKQHDKYVCDLTGDEIELKRDDSRRLLRHEICLNVEKESLMKGYEDLKRYHEEIPSIEELDNETKVLLILYAGYISEIGVSTSKEEFDSMDCKTTLLDFMLLFVDW